MEILENRDGWEAEYRAGWLAHYEQTGEFNWKLYNRPVNKKIPAGPAVALPEIRLALITTAGSYLPGLHAPFDAPNPLGDYSIRMYPSGTDLEDLAFAHDHFDHAAVAEDPRVLIPLPYLHAMVADGRLRELAPTAVSFSGYHPDVTRVIDETIPAILSVIKAEDVKGALLVPA